MGLKMDEYITEYYEIWLEENKTMKLPTLLVREKVPKILNDYYSLEKNNIHYIFRLLNSGLIFLDYLNLINIHRKKYKERNIEPAIKKLSESIMILSEIKKYSNNQSKKEILLTLEGLTQIYSDLITVGENQSKNNSSIVLNYKDKKVPFDNKLMYTDSINLYTVKQKNIKKDYNKLITHYRERDSISKIDGLRIISRHLAKILNNDKVSTKKIMKEIFNNEGDLDTSKNIKFIEICFPTLIYEETKKQYELIHPFDRPHSCFILKEGYEKGTYKKYHHNTFNNLPKISEIVI